MTDREPTPENRDCGADAAAYVLGALERTEADAFRAHLASCSVCRDEVSAFQAVADALPLAVPAQHVPRALKRRVMSSVRADSHPSRRASPRRFRLAVGLTAFPRPALAAGALVLAIAVVIGGLTLSSGAAGTRVIQASVAWHPGSAVLRVRGGRGELIVRRMPAPPGGKVYEVWLQRSPGTPTPTSALFNVTANGSGAVDVPGDLHGVSAVLVTPEPLGGSTVPTHVPVVRARLS
jgi:anti-sigma-K factor RskA